MLGIATHLTMSAVLVTWAVTWAVAWAMTWAVTWAMTQALGLHIAIDPLYFTKRSILKERVALTFPLDYSAPDLLHN